MPVQRVRRVLRKVDPWTVLKVSLVFNSIVALIFTLGTVIFWSVFVNAGIPDKINELALLIGVENGITLDGPVYFRIVVLLAVIGAVSFTGIFTLSAVVYNLISDLVGGIEVIVLEETSPKPTRQRATLPTTKPRPASAARSVLPNVKPFLRRKSKEVASTNGDHATEETTRTATGESDRVEAGEITRTGT